MELEVISMEDLKLDVEHNKIKVNYEENDNLVIEKVRIFKSIFDSIGLKNIKFIDCSINNSIFKNCYLRYANFRNVDLTGTSFENCDLLNTKFNSCNLRYVKFNQCQLNLKEIIGCLPNETNIRLALLKELRSNQLSIGENKSADEILIMIYDTERKLLLERVKCDTSYHRDREDIFSRIKAYVNYLILTLNDLIWGYGLKLLRLFNTGLIMIFLSSCIIYFFTGKEYMTATLEGNKLVKLNFWQSFYVSYTNFINLGYGNYTPITEKATIIFAIENLLGFIFFGFLVSGVYRRVAK